MLRGRLRREDDYAGAGKPVCDYEDPGAREALVDALAKDALALLAVLEGREVTEAVRQAGELLATVVGQDLDEDDTGCSGSPAPGTSRKAMSPATICSTPPT